jgi:hypothetical protein
MSQHTARHGPHATSADEPDEDAGGLPPGQPERKAARPPCGPDEGEFELAGDDDLGAADLGPAAPGFTDPDAPSGRVRK